MMRLLQTQITPFIHNFLHIEFRDQAYLYSPLHGRPTFHAHPEFELVFVLEGYGKRIIGNKVAHYEKGDMVFIGGGVPHIWLSDPVFYKPDSTLRSKVVVMYIHPKVFEQMFDLIKELDDVKEMLRQASKGINIYGKTRSMIAEKLLSLSDRTGFEKVHGFLQILHLITISSDKSFIVDEETITPAASNSDRLIEVFKFINNKFNEPVSLKQVAEVACMTVPSFCRFFKNRTKMKFSQYLVDVRIENARKLLIGSDKSISNIAYMCGYNSNSHFCKVFKDHVGQSPLQFKCNISKSAT